MMASVPRSISRSVVNRKPLYVFIVLPLRTFVSPRGLLQTILSFRWGLESIIVCETRDPRFYNPKSPALLTYIAGLKNSVYPYPLLKELIPKEFAPLLQGEIQITKKKGWGIKNQMKKGRHGMNHIHNNCYEEPFKYETKGLGSG